MADAIYSASTELWEQSQWDNLWVSIEENTLLPYSTSSRKNKSLYTTSKRIIGAINEILTASNKAVENVDEFKTRFNSIMGDEIVDPTLLENLHKIDENFFKAIYTLYEKVESGSGSVNEEQVTKIVETKIQELLSNMDGLLKDSLECKEFISSINLDNQSFSLSHIPINISDIEVYINGILYNSDCFSIDENSNTTIIWGFTEINNGFDINLEDFDIVVKYYYIKETETTEEETTNTSEEVITE